LQIFKILAVSEYLKINNTNTTNFQASADEAPKWLHKKKVFASFQITGKKSGGH